MGKLKKNKVISVRISEDLYDVLRNVAHKKKWTLSFTMLHFCRCSLALDGGSMLFADLDPDEKLALRDLLFAFESKYGVDATTGFINYGIIPCASAPEVSE